MRTGVLHQIPVLHKKFFVTCGRRGRKRNFKKSPMGLQLREMPAMTKTILFLIKKLKVKLSSCILDYLCKKLLKKNDKK